MLRKESEAVLEGNGPVPQQEVFGSGQPTLENVYRIMKEVFQEWDTKMDELVRERRSIDQRLTRLEYDARQPRLTMEEDGSANTKTHERTEGAATAVQAMHGDRFSACRVDPGPKSNSTSFGMKAEPPALPCRDDVVVESGDAAPKSCLPSLEMHSPTAAGGLVPTDETPTLTKTTYNETTLRLYATEETNPKENNLRTSISSASYDSSFWKLLAAPSCPRVIETKPMKNRTFDPGGSQGRLRACPVLGSWRALLCCCCCCCCFLTLTDPLRIQPWSQDRRNQTKSNRESEMSMESR